MSLTAKKLSQLKKDIIHPDPWKRRLAAEALSEGDERAIYPLIGLLKDENPGVQEAAMRSIIAINGEATVHMILPLLRKEPLLRNTAVVILKEIGVTAVPLVQELFEDKDNDVRKFAVDLIAEIGHCTNPERLVQILGNDPDINVRVSAAKAIGALRYRPGVLQLIMALSDTEWVCFAALESLASIGDESAIEAILSLLHSHSETLRYEAINALGAIGSPLAREPIMEHFAKAEGIEKIACVRSLVRIGAVPEMPGIADALISLFNDSDWSDRLIALRGLVEIKEEKALTHIIDAAGSLDPSEPESDEILFLIKDTLRQFGCTEGFISILLSPSLKYRGRIFAIDLVGDMGCENAVPSLMVLLQDSLSNVRQASIRALGKLNVHDARYAIIRSLEDSDGHLRREAVSALSMIGGKEAVEPIMRLLQTEQYDDVLEEAVKALFRIDPHALLSHLNTYRYKVKEIVAHCIQRHEVLPHLSDVPDSALFQQKDTN